jgi:N-acetylglucosamine-6-sulfatase
MRWKFVLGLLVLIVVSGAACMGADPAPSQQAPVSKAGIALEPVVAVVVPGTPNLQPTKHPNAQAGQPVSQQDAATPTPRLLRRPNILFILTDDLDTDSIKFMPLVKSLLIEPGASFSNHLINIPFCCPSRASILRGQYAHNTHITSNRLPLGGFQKFHSLGLENSTVATWLHESGYRTVLIGKYLNEYPEGAGETYVPPGWDQWHSPMKGNPYTGFGYILNENGNLVSYGFGSGEYGTDVYAQRAADFIKAATKDRRPFFIYLSTFTPHGAVGDGPAAPAPRHQNLFPEARVPRTASFNEPDVSDKPASIRGLPRLTDNQISDIDNLYRRRLQSLMAIDEMVKSLVDTLKEVGQLENTYIVFTSDNGFHLGQHRLFSGKQSPYEEDIRVPLVVRRPDVPPGLVIDHLTGNIDVAPTFAEWAGATTASFVDGRSLAPLLSRELPAETPWRQAFLIQKHTQANPALFVVAPYQAIRTEKYLYVEYMNGDVELYDLRQDPYQLDNLAAAADQALLQRLSDRLAGLGQCAGEECRLIENTPLLAE